MWGREADPKTWVAERAVSENARRGASMTALQNGRRPPRPRPKSKAGYTPGDPLGSSCSALNIVVIRRRKRVALISASSLATMRSTGSGVDCVLRTPTAPAAIFGIGWWNVHQNGWPILAMNLFSTRKSRRVAGKKEVAGSADAQRVGVHELANKTGSFSSDGAAATRRAMRQRPFGRP